jgi:hypothetical protein
MTIVTEDKKKGDKPEKRKKGSEAGSRSIRFFLVC